MKGKKTLTKDHHIKHFVVGGESFYFDGDIVQCKAIDYMCNRVMLISIFPNGKYRNLHSEWITLNTINN